MKLPAALSSGPRPRAAFSLIELLTVIAIIAILAGLLLSVSGYVQEKAGNSRAQGEIQSLSSALEAYKTDYGTYPEQADGKGSTSTGVLLDALNPSRKDSSASKTKVYYEFPANMLPGSSPQTYSQKLSSATYIQDPFGNPYHYQFPGDDNRSGKSFFDLWSQGKKNNADNENLWIKNW